METGLQQSLVFDPTRFRARDLLRKKQPVVLATAVDVLGQRRPEKLYETDTTTDTPDVSVHRTVVSDDNPECKTAKTSLLVPFSFHAGAEETECACAVTSKLLERCIEIDGVQEKLWERTGLPKEVQELSIHFRQLLGFGGNESSPVQRLKVTEKARKFLFAEPRIWADIKSGEYAG